MKNVNIKLVASLKLANDKGIEEDWWIYFYAMYCSIVFSKDIDTRLSGKHTFLLKIQSSIICFLSPMPILHCICNTLSMTFKSTERLVQQQAAAVLHFLSSRLNLFLHRLKIYIVRIERRMRCALAVRVQRKVAFLLIIEFNNATCHFEIRLCKFFLV